MVHTVTQSSKIPSYPPGLTAATNLSEVPRNELLSLFGYLGLLAEPAVEFVRISYILQCDYSLLYGYTPTSMRFVKNTMKAVSNIPTYSHPYNSSSRSFLFTSDNPSSCTAAAANGLHRYPQIKTRQTFFVRMHAFASIDGIHLPHGHKTYYLKIQPHDSLEIYLANNQGAFVLEHPSPVLLLGKSDSTVTRPGKSTATSPLQRQTPQDVVQLPTCHLWLRLTKGELRELAFHESEQTGAPVRFDWHDEANRAYLQLNQGRTTFYDIVAHHHHHRYQYEWYQMTARFKRVWQAREGGIGGTYVIHIDRLSEAIDIEDPTPRWRAYNSNGRKTC